MTIIIGIKCKGAIVVVCDSRTTEPSGHYRDNAQKLTAVHFGDGNSGIVAQAGNSDLSSQAVEIILRIAKEKSMEKYRVFPDCAWEAITELKNRIRAQFHGSAEEQQKHFEDYAFELMLAYFFEGKPHLFKVDFSLGQPTKVDRDYCSIGCGWVLADFLVSRLDVADFDTGSSVWTAVYAVEEIKQFDSRCGGRTRIGLVANMPGNRSEATVTDGRGVDMAMQEAQDFSAEQRRTWKLIASERINAFVRRNAIQKITGETETTF